MTIKKKQMEYMITCSIKNYANNICVYVELYLKSPDSKGYTWPRPVRDIPVNKFDES